MKTSRVKVQYAKTHLSALIASVQRGEEVVIARGDVPAARLVAVEPPTRRDLGFVAYTVPSDFTEPLPESELAAWEGGE
ncbi:type II toxin-antitoxin system Phd/YefM family antitoxin [uncultured Microbacterium sp.]|uniref:type II toxin-antitoxin system Phd/YefM family antitoxin n=1 Tax=uncultured Microbacterium sp. TaxID=191216 RepID=UPI0025CCF086|nr:type II toxin-antitoxin system Phd/YefM family antitoxin [uncultured Microbacterium sp.]